MENASKALIMAGEILIGLLVLGALLLMFNELSAYRRNETEITSDQQLSTFNSQFTQYLRNDLKGVDLVSLVNKVVDYNRRTSGYGEIDYTKKISIDIQLTSDFKSRYGSDLTAFEVKTYQIRPNGSNEFYNICHNFIKYEDRYTLDVLVTMVSNIEGLRSQSVSSSEFTIDKQPFRDFNTNRELKGENLANFLEQYSEYSLLKSSTFVVSKEAEYDDGQISKMYFKFNKVGEEIRR